MHGVALAAAELHAAPRAIVFGFEAAHGAEFPRGGGGGGSRRRGEVGWNLRGDAIEHRLVEKRGEGSRAALRLHSPASRSLPPFAAFLLLEHVPDACGGCGGKGVEKGQRRGDEGRERARTHPSSRDASGWALTVARTYPRRLRSRTRCHRHPHPQPPRYRSRARPVAPRPPARNGTVGQGGMRRGVRRGGDELGVRTVHRREERETHLSSRVVIDALERLGHGLDAGGLSLAHLRSRPPAGPRGRE